jgi:thiamine-monophosphate kinase
MKKLKEIGEFGLIGELRKRISKKSSVGVGIGDDTAVLGPFSKKDVLFTTDMLLEGRHFKLQEAEPFEIGWKAMAVNLSDVAAMGGWPTHAVVAVGLPGDLSVDFVKELYRGLIECARLFGAGIVGGDTNASEKLVISVALLGEVEKGKSVTRSGARVGDVIFVTGELGGSYASKKHLNFMPRLKEARFLTRHFSLSAMIDISDGLASDIRRVCEESRVGAVLSKEVIPVSKNCPSVERALSEGEDFELLFTLPPKEAARLTAAAHPKSMHFHPIGKIVSQKKGICLETDDGRFENLTKGGFDHFKAGK